jgi:hypothetical protein
MRRGSATTCRLRPQEHVPAMFQTAQVVPEVARRFVGVFENPATYTAWITDEASAARYLEEARSRSEDDPGSVV